MNKTLINSSEFTKIIQTKFGKIQGFKYKLSNEKWADIFLGIPFAKPPIGELRFENPQPPDTWEGILNCSEFGLSSISVDLKSFKTSKYSEDCLTLNIFCPSEISSSSSPLPVLFYIHGGGFCTGSAVDYGFKHWVENFIPQEIILVTIQYRLGPLGFLSLGEFMPGNFGLWDMALALKFVYENIENFGGNCHKITVGGLSAGGAASASLALSPITKDMVYATIEMSGTVLAEWTASEQVVTSGREFAKRALMLGEENNDSTDLISLLESTDEPLDLTSIERIKQKLKLLSVETIIKITTEMGTTRYEPNLLVWTPRIDGIFFPNDFLYLIKNKFDDKPIPSLMGVTGKEGIYFAIQGKDKFLNPFGIPREKMENFGEKEFCEFVKHSLLLSVPFKKFCQTSRKFYKEMPEYMLTEICNFYLKKKEEEKNGIKIEKETKNATFYLEQYVRVVSAVMFGT